MISDRFGFLVVAGVVSVSIAIFARLRSTRTAVDFQLAGRQIGVLTNGFAIAGDYLSAASFLGVAGAVYADGLDGAWYATGFAAGFIPVLLFVATPLRRFGDRSLPDFLGRRYRSEPLRIVAVIVVAVITLAYLIPQAVAGGLAWELLSARSLPGMTAFGTGVVATMVVAAALVVIGGMRGTTWNQALVFVVLLAILTWLAVTAAAHGYSYIGALDAVSRDPLTAPTDSGTVAVVTDRIKGGPAVFDQPGARYTQLELTALLMTLIFGAAGLPHVMNRFFASPTGRAARLTTVWVLGLVGLFYGLAIMLGTIARDAIAQVAPRVEWLSELTVDGILRVPEYALLSLGRLFGGESGLSVVVTGAMLAIMTTIGGLLLAASSAWSHDIYERHLNPNASHHQALRVGQLAVVVVALSAAAIALAFDPNQNAWIGPSAIAGLVTGAFGIAASTLTPVLILGIWWKPMNAAGALVGLVVGLSLSVAAVIAALFVPDSPTIVRIPAIVVTPLVCVLGIAVSRLTEPTADIESIWIQMHGSASDRRAERLARLAVSESPASVPSP